LSGQVGPRGIGGRRLASIVEATPDSTVREIFETNTGLVSTSDRAAIARRVLAAFQ
jgi:hypothetical protein